MEPRPKGATLSFDLDDAYRWLTEIEESLATILRRLDRVQSVLPFAAPRGPRRRLVRKYLRSGHPGGAKTAEAPGAPPVGEGPTSTEESTAGGPAATPPQERKSDKKSFGNSAGKRTPDGR